MEIWKPVPEYERHYEVSNMGRVRSVDKIIKHPRNKTMPFLKKGRILKSELDKYGYPVVTLCKDSKTRTFKVHRLVANAFIPNPDNLSQIDHINNKKYDNRPENLRWCTARENSMWRSTYYGIGHNAIHDVLCKETGKVFKGTYAAAFWIISNRKTPKTTNYNTVAKVIRYACVGRNKTAYKFHWTYLEGSTTIPQGSRDKSRNGKPRVRRVKI